jgi:hypothetical protein
MKYAFVGFGEKGKYPIIDKKVGNGIATPGSEVGLTDFDQEGYDMPNSVNAVWHVVAFLVEIRQPNLTTWRSNTVAHLLVYNGILPFLSKANKGVFHLNGVVPRCGNSWLPRESCPYTSVHIVLTIARQRGGYHQHAS